MPLIRKPQGGEQPQPPTADIASDLTSASADARWSAARQLAALPGHAQQIVEALQRETDPRVREALFSALRMLAHQHESARQLGLGNDPNRPSGT